MRITESPAAAGQGIRLAFAGAGWLGESLIKELPGFPGLQLAGVQDANAEAAERVARDYGSPWWGSAFDDLLLAPAIDAVAISTPNALHAPQTAAALGAGKHVLVQKPLSLAAVDARSLTAQARDAGRLLFVDYSYRYLETMRVLQAAVATLGPIRRIRGAFHNIYGPGKPWFFDRQLSGGGALIDLGVHLLDLALELAQPAAPLLQSASFSYNLGQEVEHAAALTLDLDGIPCDIEVSWQARRPLTEIALTVECAGGAASWQNVDGSFFRFRTVRDGTCLLDRETTLRADTLAAFQNALAGGGAAEPNTRVYDLLEEAYRRG